MSRRAAVLLIGGALLSTACLGRPVPAAPSAPVPSPADAGPEPEPEPEANPEPEPDGGRALVPDAGIAPDSATTPVFVRFWGGHGFAPGQFVEPSSVELDEDGLVIVAGHEDRVQRFFPDGGLLDIFGSPGIAPGQFDHPHGLAVDHLRGDIIYVGDQENHRLQVFTKEGVFVRQWGDEDFVHIHDVGIDRATGDVFVGDYEGDILRKFSPTGELLATYGGTGSGPGEFEGVWGVSTDSDRNVYVADTFNDRIQKLDVDGNYLLEWNEYGGTPFVKPTGVYVDTADVIYVCDSLAQLVLLFDPSGAELERWDLSEIVPFTTEPEDIVVSPDGRDLYLGEVRQHRVLQLRRPEGWPGYE